MRPTLLRDFSLQLRQIKTARSASSRVSNLSRSCSSDHAGSNKSLSDFAIVQVDHWEYGKSPIHLVEYLELDPLFLQYPFFGIILRGLPQQLVPRYLCIRPCILTRRGSAAFCKTPIFLATCTILHLSALPFGIVILRTASRASGEVVVNHSIT